MPEPATTVVITTVLIKVGEKLLTSAAAKGLTHLLDLPPLAKAVDSTSVAFPETEDLKTQLSKWCASDDFKRILESLAAGKRDFTDSSVVESFVSNTSFYLNDKTIEKAQQIVTAFLVNILDQLYASGAGLQVLGARQETIHVEQQAAIQESTATMVDRVDALEQSIQRLVPDSTGSSQIVTEKVFHARCDEARDLLREGKVLTAESILKKLRKEVEARSVTTDLQFRIATNLGSCALQLADAKTADSEFATALALQPHTQKALANAALGALVANDLDKALDHSQKALDLGRKDQHAMCVHLQVLRAMGRVHDVERILTDETWVGEDAYCGAVIADIRFKEGRYGECENAIRKSLEADEGNAQGWLLLGLSIMVPVQKRLQEMRWPGYHMPADFQKRLLEAEAAVSRAVELFEKTELQAQVNIALANRAAIRALLGNDAGVMEDSDRVLARDGKNPLVLRNKGMALLRNLRPKEALECWDKIDDPECRAEIAIPIARAYLEVGRQDNALELVLPLWKPQTDDREQLHIADMLLRIYGASRDEEAVGKIVETIKRTWPNESAACVILSHERRRSGHGGEAIKLLQKAQAVAREHEKASITLELAWAYFSEKQWKESAEAYRAVIDASTDIHTRGKYVTALYNSGAFKDAYLLSKELRGAGEVLPVITEVECLVLEQIGDFEQAKALRARLSKVEPRNAGHRVRVAMLDLRCGTRTSAAEALKQIAFDDIKDNAFWLLQVAQARSMLGLPDYLALAYRARRIDYGNPETHLAYFGLMVGREKHSEAPLDIEQVQVDCTVHLRRGDEKKAFTILDEKDVDPLRGELHRNDQLAQKLLGKRKGEQVILRQSPLEELSYEVINIQSKYVHAFQETAANFTTLFPEHFGLWQIQVGEHDVTKILRVLDDRAEVVNRVMDLYSQAPATIGCIGQLLGGGSVEMWFGLIGDSRYTLFAATGSTADVDEEVALVSRNRAVTLDIIALLTLAQLGLLDRIPELFDEIVVARPVLDELEKLLTKRQLTSSPSMTLRKEGEHYVRQEISLEALEEGRRFLDGMREFIKSQTTVSPVVGSLEFSKEKYDQLTQLYGESSIASILVARERKLPLYSDDLRLRQRARAEWQIRGFWTQSLLQQMLRNRILNEDEYSDATTKLFWLNYRHVSISARELTWALKQDGMKITPRLMRLFTVLHGTVCDEDSAVVVVADMIRLLWLETIVTPTRQFVLDLALDSLTTGRSAPAALSKLRRHVQIRFALIPQAIPDIFQSIDLFSRSRLKFRPQF